MNRKFTLMELLIVIAIIGILVSILLPSLFKAREKAKRIVCASNQKQIYTASAIYSKSNRNNYPHRVPASHWPFGHYNSREDGAGFKWDEGEILPLKTAGFSALVESKLITAYEVFYCPSSTTWFPQSNYISSIKPGTSENWFVHYSYWAGYKRALAVDDKIVSSIDSDSDAVFVSDKIGSSGSDHKFSNHNSQKGVTEGGNITFNDGSVKWRNYSSMKYRYAHGFDFWW